MSNVLNMDSIVCDLMRIWSLLLTTIKYNLLWLYLKLSKCHYHVCYWKASIKANPSNQYLKRQSINLFEQISATASTWNLSQKCWMWWNLKSFNLLTNLSFFSSCSTNCHFSCNSTKYDVLLEILERCVEIIECDSIGMHHFSWVRKIPKHLLLGFVCRINKKIVYNIKMKWIAFYRFRSPKQVQYTL